MRIETVVLVTCVSLLLIALAVFVAMSDRPAASESAEINHSEYQAIFLSNGQVYFGKISALKRDYVVLQKVFYIENKGTSQTASQNTNYTLRKLGVAELHSPEDKLIINREQLVFWENLKDSGQVVKKIKEYYKNPNAANQNNGGTQQSTTSPQNQRDSQDNPNQEP